MVFCNMELFKDGKYVIEVTILILVDGFLQYNCKANKKEEIYVTILILVDGFLQYLTKRGILKALIVTILILVDGFLQCNVRLLLVTAE